MVVGYKRAIIRNMSHFSHAIIDTCGFLQCAGRYQIANLNNTQVCDVSRCEWCLSHNVLTTVVLNNISPVDLGFISYT